MNSYERTFRNKLLIRLEDRIDALKGQVASGNFVDPSKGMDAIAGDYLKFVGKLKAYDEVLAMIDDVEKDIRTGDE
jgi:hypothetical protein